MAANQDCFAQKKKKVTIVTAPYFGRLKIKCAYITLYKKDAHDPSVNFYEMQSNYLATSFSFQPPLKVESHNKGSNINSS